MFNFFSNINIKSGLKTGSAVATFQCVSDKPYNKTIFSFLIGLQATILPSKITL